ncbi:precorrin-3B synthase [Bosea vestrisii]|uniref:Precorrin-3B synthase n=1 Tax=Bosea vestrisii TaxID=151416 RepID=A0ABW0HHT0_9HYPH
MSAPARETMRRGWCPGTLRPMLTGDGLLVRLHPPRNVLTPDQLAYIAQLASRHSNGQIEVSGRGNLQLRGIREEAHPALVDDLLAAGLVDEAEGDGPNRLVLTSPLAGRAADELLDAAALAQAVERAGRGVAGLPAKLSIVVDGGGTLALDGFAADLRLRAVAIGEVAFGLPGDLWFGPIAPDEVPQLAARLLDDFATTSRQGSGQIHRMRDLAPDTLTSLAISSRLEPMPTPATRPKPTPAGLFAERDNRIAVLAGLPFGRTDAEDLRRLGDLAREAGVDEIRVSPWRGFAFCGLPADAAVSLREVLRNEGLIVEADDPRLVVSACTGAPACTRGNAPALADAAALAEAMAPLLTGGKNLHVSGCAKSCAHPGSADLTLVGRDGRYDVIIDGGTSDTAIAHLSLTELVRRLEPGQDIRARLEAAGHQKQVFRV